MILILELEPQIPSVKGVMLFTHNSADQGDGKRVLGIGALISSCPSLSRTLMDADFCPGHCWAARSLLQQSVCCGAVNTGVCWVLHAELFVGQKGSDK